MMQTHIQVLEYRIDELFYNKSKIVANVEFKILNIASHY